MKTIEAQNPDVVLIVGDFVDDDTTKEDMIRCCAALGEIKTTYGVYYVFGNHDKGYYSPEYRGYDGDDLIEELKKNKVHVMQDDVKLIERKDYIKNPKPSGYRSLHLIVEIPIFLRSEKKNMKVEVQIRTMAMDFWRSLEHKLRYKKTLPADLEEELSHELVNCAEIISLMDMRMQEVRNKLENHEPEVKDKKEIPQNPNRETIAQTPVK